MIKNYNLEPWYQAIRSLTNDLVAPNRETVRDFFLYSRFNSQVMIEATKTGLFISEVNAPMIFFGYLPLENYTLKVPF